MKTRELEMAIHDRVHKAVVAVLNDRSADDLVLARLNIKFPSSMVWPSNTAYRDFTFFPGDIGQRLANEITFDKILLRSYPGGLVHLETVEDGGLEVEAVWYRLVPFK